MQGIFWVVVFLFSCSLYLFCPRDFLISAKKYWVVVLWCCSFLYPFHLWCILLQCCRSSKCSVYSSSVYESGAVWALVVKGSAGILGCWYISLFHICFNLVVQFTYNNTLILLAVPLLKVKWGAKNPKHGANRPRKARGELLPWFLDSFSSISKL